MKVNLRGLKTLFRSSQYEGPSVIGGCELTKRRSILRQP